MLGSISTCMHAAQERHSKKLKYASRDCAVNANYMIGVLRENKLHLVPRMSSQQEFYTFIDMAIPCVDAVNGIKQMEPTLKHLVYMLYLLIALLIMAVLNTPILLQDDLDAKRKAQ